MTSERPLIAAIVRALLYHYAISKNGTAKASSRWLTDQIETSRTDNVSLNLDDPSDDALSVSYDSVLDFFRNGKTPSSKTLDACVRFLENKQYLDQRTLRRILNAPKTEPRMRSEQISEAERADIKGLAGIHYVELPYHETTEVKSLLVSDLGDKKQAADFARRSLTYDPLQPSGKTGFEQRIDRGLFDKETIQSGFIKMVSGNPFFELMLGPDRTLTGRQRGQIIRIDEQTVRLTVADKFVPIEVYQTLSPAQAGSDFSYVNLTIRQRNNILRGQKRLSSFDENSFRRFMSGVLSEIDKRFLQAAEETKPIEMIEALIGGADINAVDPDSGKTALHYVAQGLDVFSICVLAYDEEHHRELVAAFDGKPGFDPVAVSQTLRVGHAKLDPLVMDADHRFPSECADPPWDDIEAAREDPIAQVKDMIYGCVRNLEDWAIEDRKLPRFINDAHVMSVEDRLKQWVQIGSGGEPPPDGPGF